MAGKRKAEGIALLSLYNDEESDDDDADAGDADDAEADLTLQESPGAGDEQLPLDSLQPPPPPPPLLVAVDEVIEEIEGARRGEDGAGSAGAAEGFDSSRSVPASAASEARGPMPEAVRSSPDGVAGNGSRGNIVDYAHDEAADEEGETMNAGRAVFGLAVDTSNGFLQEINITTPQDDRLDDMIEDSKLPTYPDQINTAPISEIVDVEMIAVEERDNNTTSKLDPLADFLPPPPMGKCSSELQQKFAKYLMLKNAGRSFNEELRKSKGYRNPDFLQRAVKYQEIDQIGSCFKKEIFDPHGYDPSDFYDALALEFKREQERKEQAKKQSQRVDFIHGGVQMAQISALTGTTTVSTASQVAAPSSEAVVKSDSGRIKKSKWDKVDSDSRVVAPLPPAGKTALGAHTALLTASAGSGYASYIQQKRKEVEERSRSSDKKSDRR